MVSYDKTNNNDNLLEDSYDCENLNGKQLVYMGRMTDERGIWIKVGHTDNLKQRIKALPYEFNSPDMKIEMICIYFSTNNISARNTERKTHKYFKSSRKLVEKKYGEVSHECYHNKYKHKMVDYLDKNPNLEKIEPYQVDSITKKRNNKYLVKWKGYPSEDNTWETEENIGLDNEVLVKYKKTHKSHKSKWKTKRAKKMKK